MPQRILLLGASVLLFGLAVLAGFAAAFELAPSRLRGFLASQLGAALDAEARIEALDLHFSDGGLRLVAGGIDVGPDPEERGLSVDHAEAPLDPWALLRGEVGAGSLKLDGVRISLPEEGDGDPPDLFAMLAGLREALVADPCPALPIQLHGARIAQGETPWLEDGNGWLRCGRFPERGELELRGRLPVFGPDAEIQSLRIVARGDRVDGSATLASVTLSRWFGLDWEGTADLMLEWRGPADGPDTLQGQLDGRAVALHLRKAGETLAARRARLSFHVEADAERARLVAARFEEPGQPEIRGSASIALPLSMRSALRLDVATDRIALDAPPPWIAALGRLLGRTTGPLSELDAGAVQDVSLAARTTGHGLLRLLRGDVLAKSGELEIGFSVAGAQVGRTGDGRAAITGLSGRARFDGDRLTLEDVEGRYLDEPLPRADLHVEGFQHLHGFDELNCVRPTAAFPLAGAEELDGWLESRREPGAAPSWKSLRLEVDWLTHPTLLCSLEDLVAEIRPEAPGLAVEIERGVWAGLPVQGSMRLTDEADASGIEAIAAELRFGPPFEGMHPSPPSAPWAAGRFQADADSLGDWRIRGATGRFELRGSRIDLKKVELPLAPSGLVRGSLSVDVGRAGALPFRAEATVPPMPVEAFLRAAGAPRTVLTGRLTAEGEIEGRLEPGLPPLANATGRLQMRSRDGQIHQALPVLLAIAVASDRFDPFGSRDRIDYDAIALDAVVAEGALRTDQFQLDAPTLRMAASGEVGVSAPHPVQAVTGVFFFPGLDSVIGRIPLVNRVMLGRNGNLVGAYFSVDGPWQGPAARIVPVKSLASAGPAEMLLVDLPSFVWSGIKGIQSALVPGAAVGVPETVQAASERPPAATLPGEEETILRPLGGDETEAGPAESEAPPEGDPVATEEAG